MVLVLHVRRARPRVVHVCVHTTCSMYHTHMWYSTSTVQ